MEDNLKSIQADLTNRISVYLGHSVENISLLLGINPEFNKGKLSTYKLANAMLKIHNINPLHYKSLLNSDTFIFKTVRLKKNHVPAESMSFENIDFHQLVEETWDSSCIRERFSNLVICFLVFKEIQDGIIFIGLKVWKMPTEILETEVKNFWLKLHDIVKNGVEIETVIKGGKYINKNNLPGLTENKVMHVRPKAKDSNDKVVLPNGEMITKQGYWLNASFIGEILKDVNEVVKNTEVKVKQETLFHPEELKKILINDIYSVDELVGKLSSLYPEISYLDITTESLKGTAYRFDYPFVVKETIKDIDQYIEELIFSNAYLNVDQNPIFDSPYIKRKIINYENAFKLIKVEPKLYITSKGLSNAGVTMSDITSFINDVEKFKSTDEFFTINSIRAEGFNHPVNELGFDNIFYEALLKRPNRLQSFEVAKHKVFIKSKRKKTIKDLLELLIDEDKKLSIVDFLNYLNQKLLIRINYENIKQIFKDSDLYFSEDLDKLFLTRKDYLNYIYK